MFGKCYSCIVIPTEVEGSFWHTGIASYVRQRKRGKPFAKGARKSRVQGRFLAVLEMTVGGMGLFHVAYNEYV